MIELYEQIISTMFREKVNQYDTDTYYIGEKPIKEEEAVNYLSRYLYRLMQNIVSEVAVDQEGVDRCVRFINTVIRSLAREFHLDDYQANLIEAQGAILTAIVDKASCDYPLISEYLQRITPITSLTRTHLFTGSRGSLDMYSELKKEILSSDRVDLLVSFIRVSGLNLIWDALKEFTEKGKTLRVITTTYVQATELKAIQKLASLSNTTVKISYNTENDRLHAKAYIFTRQSGFDTAYIGSSNLSKDALSDGLEWNVKITRAELPDMMDSVRNTFETYWNSDTFESFHPGEDDEKLRQALDADYEPEQKIDFSVLDLIKAKEYQKEVLEQLEVERIQHGHHRNLLVAATGTGKTVIAAFDYLRYKETHPRANLLFVVHRQEIIRQACDTFRKVLRDENFGDMWYGGHEARQFTHLFASKDILNNRLDTLSLSEDYYDYIIVDEAHHITADTYQKILHTFKPKVLLGLTATPERMDGKDVTAYFDDHISAEIRLDVALNNRLLSPFRYYGITDCVDLADVRWERGGFVASELSNVYTYNDRRTGVIFNAVQKYLPDYRNVCALCFCVDKRHAEYMQAKFMLAGLRSAVLTSDNSEQRNKFVRELSQKKINYLFVVDMFNEGIDVPCVDTVLFLRPTESLTVFLQQFGRGLRKAEGKEFLTVLDFVGHSRAEFNYMDRFRALIGRTTMGVKEEIEHGFPHLPFGCQIQLEEKAREYILENINGYINRFRLDKIVRMISRFEDEVGLPLTLTNFLRITHVPLEKIYKRFTWNSLCREAGKERTRRSEYESALSRAVSRKWLSTDSYTYFSFIHTLAGKRFCVKVNAMSEVERLRVLMFYYDLFDQPGAFTSLQQMLDAFSHDEAFTEEVVELMQYLMSHTRNLEQTDNSGLADFPLMLHGEYTKGQIQVAIRTSTLEKKSPSREGCERQIIQGKKVEAMFVDIIKDREVGSNTNYNDFSLSEELFHWESQNRVRQDSKEGQNYILQTQTMLLFVRKQQRAAEDVSRTMGYVYLGKVTLDSYQGNKPMQIVWRMQTPIPASVCEYACKFAEVG